MVNKTLLKKVSAEFREWIHDDQNTKENKLRLVRELDSNDDKDQEMLAIARCYVGKALVSYAQGNPRVETVKPYGLKAARSTKCFKALPTTSLSLTFAALYQVIRLEPSMLIKWISKPRHNITSPWPRGMIMRFIKLGKVFKEKRWQVFKAYEDEGGEYMGDEEDTSTPGKEETPITEFEEDFE